MSLRMGKPTICIGENKGTDQLLSNCEADQCFPGIFLAILGRGLKAFLIGKISNVNPEFGKFSECSKMIIFSKLT